MSNTRNLINIQMGSGGKSEPAGVDQGFLGEREVTCTSGLQN